MIIMLIVILCLWAAFSESPKKVKVKKEKESE
jgi:hypothetical protein